MTTNSEWGVKIHWQDGTDEDFKDFPQQMAKAKLKAEAKAAKKVENPDAPSSSSEEEGESDNESNVDVAKIRRFEQLENEKEEIEEMADSEEEKENDVEEDPGEGKPEARILWAAQNNQLDLVKEMVGAAPGLVGARDEDLYTPLHRAAYNNHIQVARFLLGAGADPLAMTDTGWTPMHSAAKWNNAEMVELLLAAGTPVNTISEGGLTALHVAAMSGGKCRNTVELLLMQPDIDLSLVSNQGDTACEIALRSGPLAPALFDAAAPKGVLSYRERK
eukprot:TRINITY_DN3268_c0_g1_i1.p1 TRINITY_DN3268_c0_g1~~TRINITY_DN3268_c0_g1_i1.p1  ORF type:complete len:276 (-),score=100.00 TRINITY_DN3268_c0_g1_i1:540-1367(-)